MEFKVSLEKMIKNQIEARGIKNKEVIETIRKIPRHKFVREKDIEYAYDDCPLPIGEGQTISQPYMVAYMTELLEPDKNAKVLEIGTGSGYQTAILAELFKEVYTVERIDKLQERAKKILEELKITNVFYKIGDGTCGFKEKSPFDRIILTGAIPEIPVILEEQLNKQYGIIIAPVGGVLMQKIVKITFTKGKKKQEELIGCIFVPLIGQYGFKK